MQNYNVLIYLAGDFMTYVEYGSYIEEGVFYYGDLFKELVMMKPIDTDKAVKLLTESIEELKLDADGVMQLAQLMLDYV